MATLGRLSSRTRAAGSARCCASVDWELLVIGGPVWIAALARVSHALEHEEVFATEATLALAFVVALPWLLWRSYRAKDCLSF